MIDALIRHLLESTLICMLVASLTYGLRRQAAAARHSMWLISVLKFSIPTVLLTAAGAWVALILPSTAWISSVAAKLSAILAHLFGSLPVHINVGDMTFVPLTLSILWVLGSAIMFSSWFSRFKMSHYRLSVASTQERTALNRVKRRFGFRGAVTLCCSVERNAPVLVGIYRPVIVIPSGLSEQLTEIEFDAVLLHELAHAQRRDNLASAFVHCLVCLFWFHPLLWFVEKQLIVERERACDEMVIDCGIVPEIYLAGIIKTCKFHLSGAVAGVSPANGSDLRIRFDQILCCRGSYPLPYSVRLAMAGFAVSIALLPIAGGYCKQCVSNGREITNTRLSEKSSAVQFYINH